MSLNRRGFLLSLLAPFLPRPKYPVKSFTPRYVRIVLDPHQPWNRIDIIGKEFDRALHQLQPLSFTENFSDENPVNYS